VGDGSVLEAFKQQEHHPLFGRSEVI